MDVNIKVPGKITKCTEKEYLRGLIIKNMMVSMLKTKKKERVHSIGQMEKDMKVIGRMVNNTVKEYYIILITHHKKAYGKMVENKKSLNSMITIAKKFFL